MKGDISRNTFRKERHYDSVRAQQGRVMLDADLNEQEDIARYRRETGTGDLIGTSGAPFGCAGFHVILERSDLSGPERTIRGNAGAGATDDQDFLVSAGRFSVSGILCENETLVSLCRQPDFPGQAFINLFRNNTGLPPGQGQFYLAYLDCWKRHVTAVEEQAIRETALGGPDTATRSKVIWQARILPLDAALVTRIHDGYGITPENWKIARNLIHDPDRTGGLAVRLNAGTAAPTPCSEEASGGYSGLGNQLYRIEIHQGGAAGAGATFKWSRENGSVLYRCDPANTDMRKIVLVTPVKPETDALPGGAWVEVLDDSRELNALPGDLVRIGTPDGLEIPTGSNVVWSLYSGPKIRRWDMPDMTHVFDSSNNPLAGVETRGDGVRITAGQWYELENGIRVQFESNKSYRTGDFWLVPARAITRSIEWPGTQSPQPPHGIEHHYAPLAVLQYTRNFAGLAGYMFDAQGSQHVVYRAADSHIHELYWNNSGWHHNDLTSASAAPVTTAVPSGTPAGYMFDAQGTQHLIYRGSDSHIRGEDDHIHELYWDGNWHHNDLTTASGAPAGAVPCGSPSAYMFDAQGSQQVVYRGKDRHIHELYWDGNWHHNDLTTASGAPSTAIPCGNPAGYMFDAQGSQHVIYRGEDNRIHELYWNNSGWHYNDLTTASGAPAAAVPCGNPSGYMFNAQGTQHVVYRGRDNRIHELYWDGNWHHNDLTSASGAPAAAVPCGNPAGYMFDAQGSQHVIYRGRDNRIHELYWDGNWHHNDLTSASGAPAAAVPCGDPAGYMFDAQGSQHVVYCGADSHVHELYWDGTWHHNDLSTAGSAPAAAPGYADALEDSWSAFDCRPIHPPTAGLPGLHKTGGDGQEITWDPARSPGDKIELGLPLAVAFAHGRWPAGNAGVLFRIETGSGELRTDDNRTGVQVISQTDSTGVARCWLRVWNTGTNLPVTVRATLADYYGDSLDAEPYRAGQVFTARVQTIGAGQVSYAPGDCRKLAGATTVQAALDTLCRRHETPCTVLVTPEDWETARQQNRNWAGFLDLTGQHIPDTGARVCFRAGTYRFDAPLRFAGYRHIQVSGCGPATQIIARNLESAFVFDGCDSAVVTDIAAESTLAIAEEEGKIGHLNGTLTFTGCSRVIVERAGLKCGEGILRAASCIYVRNAEPSGSARDPRTHPLGPSVRIRDCDLQIGHRQAGILVLNAQHTDISGNILDVYDRAACTFVDMLREKRFARSISRLLVPGPAKAVKETRIRKKKAAAASPVADTAAVPAAGTRAARVFVPVRQHEKIIGQYIGTLMPRSVKSTGAMHGVLVRRLAAVLANGGKKRNGAFLERKEPAIFDHLDAIYKAAAFGVQGIVVAGQYAEDVRIQGNALNNVSQGIHIGLSRHEERPDPGHFSPVSSGRVRVSGNTIQVRFMQGVRTHHGIFVGNCQSQVIEGNAIAVSRLALLLPEAQLADDQVQPVYGIELNGHFGPVLIVRENHMTDTTAGIFVKSRTALRQFLWRVTDNYSSKKPCLVSEPAGSVVSENNVP